MKRLNTLTLLATAAIHVAAPSNADTGAVPVYPAVYPASTARPASSAQTAVRPYAPTSVPPPAAIPPPTTMDSGTVVQFQPPVTLKDRSYEDAASTWQRTGHAPVLVGQDGTVMYAYGQSRATVTCAPLHVCVISLIAHEHIVALSIGDSVRWLVQSVDAGAASDVTPVVVIKPTEPDLITNLAITTDAGRVYYLTLLSDQKKYIPQVGFYDPQQIVTRIQQAHAATDTREAAHQESVVDTLGSLDPATLDFRFSCSPDSRPAKDWLPVRVFSGAGHTYVQMPDTLAYGDAPAVFNLIEVRHRIQAELLNSRLRHGYYVIDGLPVRFQLVVGAGKNVRAVTCTHG